MQKNTSIALIVAALIIGLVGGFSIDRLSTANKFERGDYARGDVRGDMRGTHTMPDGSIMHHGTNAPMDMAGMMADMNAELQGKTGDDFDKAFISEMVVHHQGAVEMAELALKHAKHQEIKDLAKAIITAQNKEIADMKAWAKSWYQQ